MSSPIQERSAAMTTPAASARSQTMARMRVARHCPARPFSAGIIPSLAPASRQAVPHHGRAHAPRRRGAPKIAQALAASQRLAVLPAASLRPLRHGVSLNSLHAHREAPSRAAEEDASMNPLLPWTLQKDWILASASPRRASILRMLGFEFEVEPTSA